MNRRQAAARNITRRKYVAFITEELDTCTELKEWMDKKAIAELAEKYLYEYKDPEVLNNIRKELQELEEFYQERRRKAEI